MTARTAPVETEETVEVEGTGLPSLRAKDGEAIQNVIRELDRIKDTARDYIVDGGSLQVVVDAGATPNLVVNHGPVAGHVAYDFTRVSHAQLAAKTDIPAKYYKRMLAQEPRLLAENANTWLQRNGDRKYLVRTLDGSARALLGNTFRPLDAGDLFWATYEPIKAAGAVITQLDVSDTRFYLRALAPGWQERIEHQREEGRAIGGHQFGGIGGFDDDFVIPGIVASTSDVGLGALKVEHFLYRLKCSNGLVGDDVFNRVHIGERQNTVGLYTRETIEKMNEIVWAQVRDVVAGAFDRERFHQWVVNLGLASGKRIEEPTAAVTAVANHYGITDERKQRILDELITGGEGSTVFGLIQAITAVGREEQNYDDGVALERIGGRLLTEADRVLVPVRSR